jgi:hypothetical protein
MTDGAAASVIMSEGKVKALGVKPIAKFKCYTTVGCQPDEMGIGPKLAIPKLMKLADMDLKDIGLFEINEAFASQVLYCIDELPNFVPLCSATCGSTVSNTAWNPCASAGVWAQPPCLKCVTNVRTQAV